jgi:hypothetical protein
MSNCLVCSSHKIEKLRNYKAKSIIFQSMNLFKCKDSNNLWKDQKNVFVHDFDLLSTTIQEDLETIFSNYSKIDFL